MSSRSVILPAMSAGKERVRDRRGERSAAAREQPGAAMTLPLKPPIQPQLARSRAELPAGEQWAYEPKYDGFRAIVFVDGEEVTILVNRCAGLLAPACVVEPVI